MQGDAPSLEVDITDYGYRYFGVRQLGADQQYVRGYHFVMPWTQLRPAGRGIHNQTHGHHWTPIDDHHCLVWNWYYNEETPLSKGKAGPEETGNVFGVDVDWENGFRSVRNRSNGWMIDRAAQKTETFTGIVGINTQDRAVQEMMGPIVDRSREHLGPADRAIITARKLLEEAVRTVQDGGDPPGVSSRYYELRAAENVLAASDDWRADLLPRMDRSLARV